MQHDQRGSTFTSLVKTRLGQRLERLEHAAERRAAKAIRQRLATAAAACPSPLLLSLLQRCNDMAASTAEPPAASARQAAAKRKVQPPSLPADEPAASVQKTVRKAKKAAKSLPAEEEADEKVPSDAPAVSAAPAKAAEASVQQKQPEVSKSDGPPSKAIQSLVSQAPRPSLAASSKESEGEEQVLTGSEAARLLSAGAVGRAAVRGSSFHKSATGSGRWDDVDEGLAQQQDAINRQAKPLRRCVRLTLCLGCVLFLLRVFLC